MNMKTYKGNFQEDNKLEKYYTPDKYVDMLCGIMERNCDISTITEFLENSAGAGNIMDFLQYYKKPILAYDIHNETQRTDIIECDYLKTKIPYKAGRVAIINPPFHKGLKFVYKALEESDYCVAILSPTSLLNINFDKYIADEIIIAKRVKFDSCITDILLIGIRKK